MKIKSILALALCVVALSGYGQTEKGTILLGGSLTLSRTNSTTTYTYGGTTLPTDSKQMDIRISPNISYFVINHLAVGVITPFTYTRITVDDQHLSGHSYAVGPLARYYFRLGSHWAIFPEVSYTYGWTVNQRLYADPFSPGTKFHGNTHDFQGGIGGVYFLNKSIGLEGKFYYDSSHSDYSINQTPFREEGNTDITSLNFGAGIQIYFARNAR